MQDIMAQVEWIISGKYKIAFFQKQNGKIHITRYEYIAMLIYSLLCAYFGMFIVFLIHCILREHRLIVTTHD
jgi:hypothetical protein